MVIILPEFPIHISASNLIIRYVKSNSFFKNINSFDDPLPDIEPNYPDYQELLVEAKETNQSISHIVEEYLTELKKQQEKGTKEQKLDKRIEKLYGAFEDEPIPDKKDLGISDI